MDTPADLAVQVQRHTPPTMAPESEVRLSGSRTPERAWPSQGLAGALCVVVGRIARASPEEGSNLTCFDGSRLTACVLATTRWRKSSHDPIRRGQRADGGAGRRQSEPRALTFGTGDEAVSLDRYDPVWRACRLGQIETITVSR